MAHVLWPTAAGDRTKGACCWQVLACNGRRRGMCSKCLSTKTKISDKNYSSSTASEQTKLWWSFETESVNTRLNPSSSPELD